MLPRLFPALTLASLLCASFSSAQTPPPVFDAYISTGDNHWLGSSLPIDSARSIEDTMEVLQKVSGVQRVYWRGLEEATWVRSMKERPENCRYYSFWVWMRRLYREVDPDVLAVRAAKKRGMEIWGVGTLFDWGAAADTPGFGDYPANAESLLRLEHPEWAPVDKQGFRKQGGPIELAYPEARQALVKLHVDEVLRAGYDGMSLLTYVENYSLRFQDEFGYSPPIVEEFKRRFKVDITREPFTRYASKEDWYRLRGEYVTAYLRELKAALARHGKKLGVFLAAHDLRKPQPWNVPELMRTSGMMHLDLETWAREGVVDLFMVNGNSSPQIQDAAIRECRWLTRQTATEVTFLTSSPHAEKWKPLHAEGVRAIYALNEDVHFASRSGVPEQAAEALKSGDLARECKALAQVVEGTLKAGVEELAPLAREGNVVRRRLALKALAKTGDNAALPFIEGALRDSENGIRCMAAECLRTLIRPESVAALLAAVEKHGNHPLRESLVPTLVKNLPLARPALRAAAGHASENVRMVCLKALASAPEKADLEVFQNAFIKGERYPRFLATEGLGNLRHEPAAVTQLVKLVMHHDAVIANRAAASLAVMARTRNPALEPARAEVLAVLKRRFQLFGGGYLGIDADWGWRVVGNALRDFGVQDPKEVLGSNPDALLAEHAFAVWRLPQKPASFSEVSEVENEAAYAHRPPPPPPPRAPETLRVDRDAGPYKSIREAVRAARPGDTIALTPGVYYESVDFTDRSGAPGRPIVVDGQGSTVDGSEPVDLATWEGLGNDLYRKKNPNTPKLVKETVARFYLLFDGHMQRMGQCSKGRRAPFKKPEELGENEWTYQAEEDALYLRAKPGVQVRMPVRSNGLIVAGTCAHLVIKNLTATHVYNDGANIHGWCRDVTFENIRCIECGDDGISAHDDCQIVVNGLVSERNATGIADVGDSVSLYRNVVVRDCVGFDLYFLGSNAHEIIGGEIHSSADRALVVDGQYEGGAFGPCTVLLRDVTLKRVGAPQEIRVGYNCTLTLENVRCVDLGVTAVGGSMMVRNCSFTGGSDLQMLLWPQARWAGDNNVFGFKAIRHDKTWFYPKDLPAWQEHVTGDRATTWK